MTKQPLDPRVTRAVWQVATSMCWVPGIETIEPRTIDGIRRQCSPLNKDMRPSIEPFNRLRDLGYLDYDADGYVTVLVPFGSYSEADIAPLAMPEDIHGLPMVWARKLKVTP